MKAEDVHVSASRPSVLLVGNFLSAAGGSRGVCEELSDRLRAAGLPVATTSSKKGKVRRLFDMLATVWSQRTRYAVAHVDVFSGPAFLWADAVCAALRLAGKPYILTLHGGSLPEFASRRPARVERLLRSAAAVTTPSRYLIDAFASCRPDIRFIPNGVDLAAYSPRRRFGARPNIVWLRAFHRTYNPSLAVRVLRHLTRDFSDARLTMVGADKRDGALQAAATLAVDLGVQRHVRFCGPIPKADVPRFLDTADIFLNTSNVDNMPVSVLEAMASGLCVVSTNVGGLRDLIDDEQDGLLVPPDDPLAMAGAVTRVVEHPDVADRLSRTSRKKAERFDWPPIIGEWRALFAAAAGGAV